MLEIVSSKFPFTTHTLAADFRVFARVCGSVQPPHKNKKSSYDAFWIPLYPCSYQLCEFEKNGVDKWVPATTSLKCVLPTHLEHLP